MTREEIYLDVIKRWPQYRVGDVADLTPEQILWHLENAAPKNLTFDSMEEYQQWLLRTKS